MRKFALSVAVVALVGFSVALAEEFQATIKSVDGNKVTVNRKKDKKDKVGEEKTYTLTKDCKVVKGKFNADTMKLEAGDAIDGGLKNELFSKEKLGDKGLGARFTTNDDGNVTQIIVGGKKKKKAAN